MRRTNLDETALLIAIKYRNPVVQILLEHPDIGRQIWRNSVNTCNFSYCSDFVRASRNRYQSLRL